MNSATFPILTALFIQLALGLVVFQANRHLKSNQAFLLLSLVAAGWLCTMYAAITARNLAVAEFWIRQTYAVGALIPAAFNLLRLSIRERQASWKVILGQSRLWIVLTIAAVIFCQTNWFMTGARFSNALGSSVPDAIYAYPGIIIFGVTFGLAIITLVIAAIRDLRISSGAVRAELGFIMIGGVGILAFSLLAYQVLRFFIESSRLLWFAPLRVVLFSAIVGYGIVTRKMMEVGVLLRRFISYALLATYLLALYALVWWLVTTALQSSVANAHSIAHVTAAVVIAFAMAPARGISQRLAERLFIGSHRLDFRATVSKAAKILASVTTLRDLLDRFANTVAEAVGTDRVFILLPDKQGFSQRYPIVEPGARFCLELTRDQATIAELELNREPIVLDELRRVRPTPQLQRVMRQLDSLQIALAMGIFARDHLAGVLLLGARKSGRIYGATEQGALQVLCGQLAVAIENAELFTEVQNAKIYNEQDRQVLGALMVLTDITAIKRLELQIRRSDRLASLGTLSAGMAHEIKNPLVSLKTFAQLLPERYQDSDFRDTFSNLIGHEIDRIDSLVNQLLRFARPAKPILKPLHAHEILEKALTLVGHRLYQKDIKLDRLWRADVDTIHGDADQLEQVFLNFFLNAMDAMKTHGELSVNTEIRSDEQWVSALTYTNGESSGNGQARQALRITIRDSGEGIRAEDIPHVFDPFFTTKDYGTGLGLSVVHGIIQEHGGQIEVESELQKGTAFHISLPLVRFDSKVAAA